MVESTTEERDLISRPNNLQFIQVEIDNYAGLNYQDKALVIAFPDSKPICEVTGDQGAGKTSFLNAMKAFMGEPEPANAINSQSLSKSGTFTFKVGDELYKARITQSSFKLTNTKDNEGGKPIVSTINKPKDVLSSLIGPIGVSPSFIQKKKSGEEQIEWLKSLIGNSNKEVIALEAECQQKYDAAFKERTGVNASVERIKNHIIGLGYYAWSVDEKEFKAYAEKLAADKSEIESAPQNEDEIAAKYNIAAQRSSELTSATNRKGQLEEMLSNLGESIVDIDMQIARLTELKKSKELEKEKMKESIVAANNYIEDRKNASEELAIAVKAMQDSGRIENLRKAISVNDDALKEFYVQKAEQDRLNASLVEYEKVMREIARAYTPPIEGLEIEPGGTIDSKRPIGAYYKGTNISFLSESELWDLCLQIWKLTGTQVVFIENSTVLGSKAMERVNWFAQNGGYVFMSTLERNYKELSVTFHKEKI